MSQDYIYKLSYFISVLITFLTFGATTSSIAQTGALDPTFGTNGSVITSFTDYGSQVNAMAIQPDGKIIVGGYSFNYYSKSDFTLSRYMTDGSLDTSFGSNGQVITNISLRSKGTTIALQDDGKIVLGGNDSHAINIARYETDGSLDTSFGTGGTVILSIPGFYGNRSKSLLIQDDGKILIGGNNSHSTNDNFHYFLIRCSSSGTLDSTFGAGGIVYGTTEKVNSIALQNDGKIIVAGTDYSDFNLFRYETDGSLDSTFGINGKVTTPITTMYSEATSAKVLDNGKILLGGFAYNALTVSDFALAQYNNDGTLDTTFGNAGTMTTSFPNNSSFSQDLARQNDGKIVLAGYTSPSNFSGSSNFIAARYTSNGQLDLSFGSGGQAVTNLTSSHDQANAVSVQGDGKILLAGFSTPDSTAEFSLIRYNENAVDLFEIELNPDEATTAITLFPNPLSHSSAIRSTYELTDIDLVVSDQTGRVVRTYSHVSGYSFPFYPNQLPNGVYLLKILDKDQIIGRITFVISVH